MRQLPERARRQRRARRGRRRGDGALVVVVLDGAVAALSAERAPHQLGTGEAVGRAQHAGAQAGRSVGEGRGVCARVVRYVRRPVGVRLRRRVGQRAHGAQHVAQQRVQLVGRAGSRAAPRRRDARVHGGAERRGGPAARAHHRGVDGPVQGPERVRRLGSVACLTPRARPFCTAVILT